MVHELVWEQKNAEWHVKVFNDGVILASECVGGAIQSDGEIITMDKASARSLAALIALIPS